MISTIFQLLFIPIIVIVVLRLTGLTGSKRKSITAATAPLGSRVSRIVESALLLCVAGVIYLFTATNTSINGMLLNLEHLTEPLKQIHLAAAGVVLGLLIVSVLMTFFWRGSVGIVLATMTLIVYGFFLNGNLMERLFWEYDDILAPKLEYTFQMSGKFTGGEELWINDVYMGKMPLTITWEEFSEKVPFMAEPPEGFRDENSQQPAEPWCRFTFWALKKRDRPSGLSYASDSQDYYAKIRFNGQWAKSAGGGGGGGGGRWYRQYDYSFYGDFPDREKLIEEENNRFDTLVQKARLSSYVIDMDWFNAFKTFDRERFWDLRRLAENEPGFEQVMDAIARFQYDIPDTVDPQTAQRTFERICKDADVSMEFDAGGIEGRALELVYDKLDVERLVDDCRKGLKSGRDLQYSTSWRSGEYEDYKKYSHDPKHYISRNGLLPASFSVVRYAVLLWDQKLDAEYRSTDNIVETEIAPLYIAFRSHIEAATQLGGSSVEQYLLRQFRRHPQIGGMDLGHDNTEYVDGQQLNKWLYHLVQLDTPGGREFRKRYSSQTEKMIQLLIDNDMNRDRHLRDFLFYDLDRGKQSLAVRFWPEYSASVETSFPGWEESKLEKRLQYLGRLGDLATDEMYVDSWKRVDIGELSHAGQTIRAIRMLPRQRQLFRAQYIVNDLKERKNQIRYNSDVIIRELENYLVCLGDASSMQEFLSLESGQKRDRLREIKNAIDNYIFKYDRGDVAADFIASGDADLKKLAIEYLRETPMPENAALLMPLTKDPDAGVKQAAEEAMKELEDIRQMPCQELISLESTYTPPV